MLSGRECYELLVMFIIFDTNVWYISHTTNHSAPRTFDFLPISFQDRDLLNPDCNLMYLQGSHGVTTLS